MADIPVISIEMDARTYLIEKRDELSAALLEHKGQVLKADTTSQIQIHVYDTRNKIEALNREIDKAKVIIEQWETKQNRIPGDNNHG